jgi:hypothetical protein
MAKSQPPARKRRVLVSAVNSLHTLSSVLVDRYRFMRQAGLSFGGKRDLYEVLGYDREISAAQHRQRFDRGGIAGRVVDALPKATWRNGFELVEDEDPNKNTAFEQTWVDLAERLKIASVLQRADVMASLSTYSVILLGAPGELSDPLPKGTPDKLLYLTPFSGGGGPGSSRRASSGGIDSDATIRDYVTDTKDPRFGKPLSYQLRRVDISSPDLQQPVHWTRVIHVPADGILDDEVFGAPAMERVWNLLDDLDKVTGGGAEAFWLRANQGLQLDLDPKTDLSAAGAENLKAEVEEYKHNISRILKTRGITANTLGSDVANFSGPADAILTQIAGAKAIPKRILTGSEMGELASSQDRENWRDQVNGRRSSYADPYIVKELVDRLVEYGYLPKPKRYVVKWSTIETLTENEKSAGASSWASTNATQGKPVFTTSEIRDKWYGMEPLTEEQLEEEKKLAEATAQPAPAPAQAPPGVDSAGADPVAGSTDDEPGDKVDPDDVEVKDEDAKSAVRRAAEIAALDEAILSQLELALAAGDLAEVGRICGVVE